MSFGIIFAILGAFVEGLWAVFHQQASHHINSLFGAIIISFTAVVLGLFLLLLNMKSVTLVSDSRGILFSILAGLMALGIDYFALRAYSSGLEVSIVGPIIIGGGIAVAAALGFFLGDSISVTKLLALALAIMGSALLVVSSGR